MSGFQHTSVVEKGLKMKIKRKNVNGSGTAKSETKHEIVKTEGRVPESTPAPGPNGVLHEKAKAQFAMEKDKSPKMKGPHKKDKVKEKGKCTESGSLPNGAIVCAGGSVSNGLDITSAAVFGQAPVEQRAGDPGHPRRENPVVDPYEFNAKVEDGIGLPLKKMKSEKVDTASSPLQPGVHDKMDRCVGTCDMSTITEPECIGPCEPGTSVCLEGIVWHETQGVLVVNVTWRDKTYVGTLLDATKHEWAPPRFNCESPVSDFETRVPKGRGKRGRGAGTPVSAEKGEGRKLRKGRRGSSTFTAPPSPARSDISSVSSGSKRKGRSLEAELSAPTEPKLPKRSRGTSGSRSGSPKMIECPEPNCCKKYKHANGLRYHMTNHHPKSEINPRSVTPMEVSDKEDDDEVSVSTSSAPKDSRSDTGKESEVSRDKDNSPIEDDIPLKEIARSAQQERKAMETGRSDGQRSELSAKKRDMAPVSAAPVSTPVSVTKSTPQLFHLPGPSIACLGTSGAAVMTQAAIMSPATVTCATTVSGVPICVPTVPSSMDLVKTEPLTARPDQRSKQKTVTRPIVPAPTPLMGLGSPANVSQSSLSPVSAHGQVSPSLKPIQPKPTILGEMPPNRDPLVGLNNGRTKTKKKSKKEMGNMNINSPNTPRPLGKETTGKDDTPSKCERPAVIRSIPSPSRIQDSVLRKEPVVNVSDIQKFSADLQRTGATSATVISAQVASAKACEVAAAVTAASLPGSARLQQQQQQPLNQLKVNSPLQIATSERKTPVPEDVQSPAYSDISDANDSGSPQDSPQKKDDGMSKKEDSSATAPPSVDARPPYENVYNYGYPGLLFSQPTLGSQMSPGSAKTVTMGKDGVSVGPDKKLQRGEDLRKTIPSMGLMVPSATIKIEDQGDEGKSRKVENELNPLQLPQYFAFQDANYQLLLQQQQLMALQSGKWMHEPVVRAKFEEPRRAPTETEVKAMETWPSAMDHSARDPTLSLPKFHPAAGERERDVKKSPGDMQDHNLREKQNENHQILKENIELKSQMDQSQNEQYQRYQLFHQQKLYEQQQQKLGKPPPKLQSSESPSLKVASHSRGSSDVGKGEDVPRDFLRKDFGDGSKGRDSHRDVGKPSDGQLKEDKVRLSDGSRDLKSKANTVGLSPAGASVVTTAVSSGPAVSYATNPAFMFGGFPFPPHTVYSRNLYPYSPHPGPLHPLYQATPVDVEKEKGEAKARRVEMEGKGTESEPQGQQFYPGNMHKIHELGEKGLPSAHASSPQPPKGSDTVTASQGGLAVDKGREFSSSSPPPQRHYHTHHHTHVVRSIPPFYSPDNYNGILNTKGAVAHSYPPK